MAAPRLTAEETKEIIEFFESGTTCKEIAELYERQYGTIWLLLKRNGVLKNDKPKKDKVSEKEVPAFDARRVPPVVEEEKKQPRNLHINRGEIYYITKTPNRLPTEQEAGRPAIVVSNNKNNLFSDFIEVVYLTTQAKNPIPTHVTVRSFNKYAIALCEQIHTVHKDRVAQYGRTCSDAEMTLIDNALAVSLGLNFESVTSPAEVISEPFVEEEEINTDYQEVVFERDTYKRLYEELLDKLVRR